MKRLVVICIVLACVCLSLMAVLLVRNPSSAKSQAGARWTYAAITGVYVPYPTDNPTANATAAVNICYFQPSGCRNEEVRAIVSYSAFSQDFRIENSADLRRLALNNAFETAYAKAVSKLGAEGWEMISTPETQFSVYAPNSGGGFTIQEGNFNIQEGNKKPRPDIYFKRSN